MAEPNTNTIAWIDTETGGLKSHDHPILEIAVLITNNELEVVAETSSLISLEGRKLIDVCEPYAYGMHQKNGLVEAFEHDDYPTLGEVEQQLIEFLAQHHATGSLVAGSSIGFDRRFLEVHMPTLNEEHLHYRTLDVSTIKETARRWAPHVFETAPKKTLGHRGLPDIYESLAEFKHYLANGLWG